MQDLSCLLAPVDVLSRLVLLSSSFMSAFVRADGIGALCDIGAFAPDSPSRIIVNALLIASQLARSSDKNYAALQSAGSGGAHGLLTPSCLSALLMHSEAPVRAKTCNLLGNLCRHSG